MRSSRKSPARRTRIGRRYCKGGVAIENAGGWNPDEGESPPERQSAIIRAYMPQTPAYRSNREMVYIVCSSSPSA